MQVRKIWPTVSGGAERGKTVGFLITAYFNIYTFNEEMAERNTSAGRALLLRQNCKEGPGGQILLFSCATVSALISLKESKT